MMNKSMPSYQQFLQDEERRAAVKKGKTKKRVPGHLYSTLTGGDVYFSTFYKWYEPVFKENSRYNWYKDLVGFKKLKVPAVKYWQPCYSDKYSKKSEYFEHSFYLNDSTPARVDSGVVAELDIPDEEILNRRLKGLCDDIFSGKYSLAAFTDSIGLGISKDNYEMPEQLRELIIKKGYKVWDE